MIISCEEHVSVNEDAWRHRHTYLDPSQLPKTIRDAVPCSQRWWCRVAKTPAFRALAGHSRNWLRSTKWAPSSPWSGLARRSFPSPSAPSTPPSTTALSRSSPEPSSSCWPAWVSSLQRFTCRCIQLLLSVYILHPALVFALFQCGIKHTIYFSVYILHPTLVVHFFQCSIKYTILLLLLVTSISVRILRPLITCSFKQYICKLFIKDSFLDTPFHGDHNLSIYYFLFNWTFFF